MAENAEILQDPQQPVLQLIGTGDEEAKDARPSKFPYGIRFLAGRELASVYVEAVWQRRSEVVGKDPRFFPEGRVIEHLPGIGVAFYSPSVGGVYRYLLPEG